MATLAKKDKTTGKDFSILDAYVEKQKRESHLAPSKKNVLPYSRDERTISTYESIPNYNVLERMFDKSKAKAYDKKQSLVDAYANAKTRQTEKFIQKHNITSDMLENTFGITNGKGIGMGTSITIPQTESSKRDSEYISSIPGVDMDALRKYYESNLNKSAAESMKEYASEHPVIGTVPTLSKGVGGLLGTLEGTKGYLSGEPISKENSNTMSKVNDLNEVRGVASKSLQDKADTELGKKATNLLYGVGTSIADMGMGYLLTPYAPVVTLGANAATDTMIDTSDRGLNPNQIMATSSVAGAAEAVFEKLSLKNLKNIVSGGAAKEAGKTLFKQILGQMTTEAGEEMTTEVVNEVADRIINKDLSHFVQRVEQYQSSGMSEQDAKTQAWKDLAGQIGYAGLAGAVSGGIMGGGATAVNALKNNVETKADPISELQKLDPMDATGTQKMSEQLATEQPAMAKQAQKDTSTELPDGVHTPEQLKIMEEYKNSSNAQIGIWADRKRSGQKSYKYLPVATVNNVVADLVQQRYGINIHGNSVGLNASSLNHIDNEHVNNKSKSKIANEDLERIGYVLEHPDDVVLTDETTTATRTKDNQLAPKIVLRKRIDGHYYIVEAVTDAASGQDIVISAFIEEVGKETQEYKELFKGAYHVPSALENSSPLAHVQNVHENSSFDNSISNSTESVNNVADNSANSVKYNKKSINGFNDVSKEYDRTRIKGKQFKKMDEELNGIIGMFAGEGYSEEFLGDLKANMNEFLETGSVETWKKILLDIRDIDMALQGQTYSDEYGDYTYQNDASRVFKKYMNTLIKSTKHKTSPTTSTSKVEVRSNDVASESMAKNDDFIPLADYIKSRNTTKIEDGMFQTQSRQTEDFNTTVDPTLVQRIAQARAAHEASGRQRKRGYNTTLIEKTDAPQELKKEFINNPDMYTQLSNAETLATAIEIMENSSTETAIAKYHELLDKKNPVAVPLGYNLSKQLSQDGRLDESVQLVREMSRALTESGQFSQAAAITMLNNDPEAAKRYLVREIDVMNQKGKEKYGKKWTDFELTESELQQFTNIKTGDTDAIKAAYETVYNRLRKQYPATMTEKLMEFRRVSMLLNMRTNVRNIVSNALLFPVRWTSDRVSALGEGVYSLIDPKYHRTQSINPIRSKQTKKLASEAFETVRAELLGDSKYEDAKDAMRDKQVFKGSKTAQMLDTITNGAVTKANRAMGKEIAPSLLETARNFTYFLLKKGDDVFVRKNFESRMASYLDAQGITELENIPADAYVLATQEALKATFKDDSALANGLSAFRQMFNKAPGHFIGDAVMPFTKTPANLAMRGIDYSPAGIYNGIKTLRNAKNNAEIAKGITQLGQAVTGTAAIALGYVLAEVGFISGALSEDKDEAQFQKQQGMLPYSININGNHFSYDWAQPASIPLILGVTIYDSWNNEKDFINGLKQGTLAAVDSWLELSPLQNLSDLFGGYSTTAENAWDVLSTDLPLSFLSAQMGAAAKTGDTTQRVTYDQTSYWNNLLNQAKAKIPGLSNNLPVAYDTWGNPIQRQDSTGEAAFANLLNPGQFGNANVSPIDDEISALYESTNDASVFPRKAKWTENNVKLTNEQYSEFQRIMGENAYDMANAFINSVNYDSMDDELKVKAIGEMYSFAHAMAQSEVTGYDIAGSQSYKNVYSVFKEKGAEGVATYYAITVSKAGTKNLDFVNAVNAVDISNEDKGYYLSIMLGELSKEATEAYNSGGYEAIYNLYSQKTMADRIKQIREQNTIERIKKAREQSNNGVTPELIERIRVLRSQM